MTETFFGYMVSVYSLGQMFGSPLIGWLSNRCGRIRPLLYACLALMFTGNTIYFSVELFPVAGRRWAMLVGRFITGMGSSVFT
jgi:predicted MFS family arabinose efflux permease